MHFLDWADIATMRTQLRFLDWKPPLHVLEPTPTLRSPSARLEQAHIEPTQHHSSRYPSWQNRLMPSSPRGPDSPDPTLQRSTTSSPTFTPPCQLCPSNPPAFIPSTLLVDQHPLHQGTNPRHPHQPSAVQPGHRAHRHLPRSNRPTATSPRAEASAAPRQSWAPPPKAMSRALLRRRHPGRHQGHLVAPSRRVQDLNRRTSSQLNTTRVDIRPGRTASCRAAHEGPTRPSRRCNAAPPRRPRSLPPLSALPSNPPAFIPSTLLVDQHPLHHQPRRPAPTHGRSAAQPRRRTGSRAIERIDTCRAYVGCPASDRSGKTRSKRPTATSASTRASAAPMQ
jgi:hypothetical protein